MAPGSTSRFTWTIGLTWNAEHCIIGPAYFRANGAYHSTFHICEDSEGYRLTDVLEIHFMEIPKLMVNWRHRAVNPHTDLLVRWLLLLEAAEDNEIRSELEAIAMSDPVMREAFEKWEDISRDPHALAEYHSRRMALLDEAAIARELELREQRAQQRAQQAREEGRLEGKQEGTEEALESVAKRMLAAGQDVVTIAEFTGLSHDEITALQAEIQ